MDTIPPISSLTDPRNLLTLATLAGLISMGYYGMIGREPHRRRVLFSLYLMAVPFLPASNLFFPVGFVIAERVLYITSMGFCMLVAYGIFILTTKLKHYKQLEKAATVAAISLLLLFGLRTFLRNGDWYDNHTLFSSAIKIGTRDMLLINNLAVFAEQEGKKELAVKVYRHGIKTNPQHLPCYFSLGKILMEEGKIDEAIKV